MKRILLAAVAVAFVGAATPAMAQFYAGVSPGGAGVEVGPFGVGIGPAWGYRHRYYRDYAYEPYCHTVSTQVVTPRGHVYWRTHRVCN
jgi:hypothetical protein